MNFPNLKFTPSGPLDYKIGTYQKYVPPWLADTVMIQPANEYGLSTSGVLTKYGGTYWMNANSSVAAGSALMTDLQYLQQNDLALLPNVKKVILAIRWYTSLDADTGWTNGIGPAIGPEVQAWNWVNAGVTPPEYLVYYWTRANAYWLQPNHQVWPTPDDASVIQGVQFLQSQGYEVGICPIATMISKNYYYPGGGECEVDRWNKQWANVSSATAYLANFQIFIQHYVDLLVKNSLRPWVMYLGYGMRDLTWHANPMVVNQFIATIHTLADYCKSKLPNTLTTYAADIDEYYYPYLVRQSNNYLDPLWTIPNLDYVGVNWFAPLTIDDSEDAHTLVTGVQHGEAEDFYLPNVFWRAQTADRLITNTTRNFKTGLAQTPINALVQGIKDIIDWQNFYHYTPAISTNLAGATPLPGMSLVDKRMCSPMSGLGPVGSVTAYTPLTGGIAPAPALKDTWLAIQLHSYAYLSLPASIPDPTVFNFEIIFELDAALTDLSRNYRLLETSFGLKIDSLDGTITLWFLQTDGSYRQYPLFSATFGQINLVYAKDSIQILVDGAYDLTVIPAAGSYFQMPAPLDKVWLGNPQNTNLPQNTQETLRIPSNYGIWQGKIYYLEFTFGAGVPTAGSQFYMDDSYGGVRTAWEPGMKPWMATSFGYGSVRGSAADPLTKVQTVIRSGVTPANTIIPSWYADYFAVTSAVYRGSCMVWEIEGPYGSTFDPDDIYQAVVMNAATLGLIDAGAIHQVAWYFDTRSGGAFTLKASNGVQIFNDAYDFELNSVLNSKAAVRDSGIRTLDDPLATVDNMLGLSIVPGPEPPVRAILVQPGTPQL